MCSNEYQMIAIAWPMIEHNRCIYMCESSVIQLTYIAFSVAFILDGCKYLCEMILYRCVQQINEIRKLTHSQRDLLNNLRINFDKPTQMKIYLKQLEHVDLLLQRVILIGVLLQLKNLIEESLQDVLHKRMPFLMITLEHFYAQYKTTTFSNDPQHHLLINEMISSTGTSTIIDSTLCQALINQKNTMNNATNNHHVDTHSNSNDSEEYILSCLILVYIAVALPRLARLESTKYIVALDAHANNCHCLIRAINTLITTFFFEHGQRHIEDRCKEFLALASSSLLRLIDVDCGQNTKSSSTTTNSASNNTNGLSTDIIHKEATYILLEQFVEQCPYLTRDLLETCFPSSVLRNAFFIISSHLE
jgi:NCK-associated protein 1